ncbi:hypothetical protein BDA99DRAFT_579514 [Phascolomyces articulosus]|uniref:FAD-binding domain-containing protein n=1 Tax=Phascolomyces articulosus TaxID=60185 RepID=A0AAD5PEL6_9FUNG|nr:hypothetical protein BDA99DRAFT_579514 [Phascolomyces articulosus]
MTEFTSSQDNNNHNIKNQKKQERVLIIGGDPKKYSTLGPRTTVNPDHPEQGALVMVDGNNNNRRISIINPPRNANVFRINRKRLRHWLLEDISDENSIAWSKIFDHYTLSDDGGIQATFTDGTVERGSLLVGADGNNSGVCQQLIGPELYEKTTNYIKIHSYGTGYWVDPVLRSKLAEISPACMIVPASHSESDNHSTCLFVSLVETDHSREKTPYLMMWGMTWYKNEDENDEGVDCKRAPPPLSPQEQPLQQQYSTSLLEKVKAQATHVGFTGPLLQLIMETPVDSKVVSLTSKERSPHPALQTFGLELGKVYKNKHPMEEAVSAYNKEMIPRGQCAVVSSRISAEAFHSSPKVFREYMSATLVQSPTATTTTAYTKNKEYHCWKDKVNQCGNYLEDQHTKETPSHNKKLSYFKRLIGIVCCSSTVVIHCQPGNLLILLLSQPFLLLNRIKITHPSRPSQINKIITSVRMFYLLWEKGLKYGVSHENTDV